MRYFKSIETRDIYSFIIYRQFFIASILFSVFR